MSCFTSLDGWANSPPGPGGQSLIDTARRRSAESQQKEADRLDREAEADFIERRAVRFTTAID